MGLVRIAAASLPSTVLAVAALAVLAVALGASFFETSVGGGAAVYFVVWWTVLFAMLPFGVRSQAESGEVVSGSEPGAPAMPMLREKAIWTSLAAAVVFVVTVALLPLTGL